MGSPERQEAVLKMLEPLPGMISELLEAGCITDAYTRHCLAFTEMEVSATVASLKMPLPPPRDRRGVDPQRQEYWLSSVEYFGWSTVKSLAGNLRKAMWCRCFRRPRSFDHYIPFMAYLLYCSCSNDPRLELPSSELMPSPPQAAQVEAAAVHGHLVGIDGTANELLGWLMAADESLRVMAIAGPAGIGKTTFAMELHRRLRCQTQENYFQCHVVANFSRRPHRSKLLPQTILKHIIEQLEAPSSPNSLEITMLELEDDPELLARNISKRLKDKR